MKKCDDTILNITEDEAFELAYYNLAFFNGWEGRSSTVVFSNKDHTVYSYSRVLPGLHKEICLFQLTGIYAKQLWAVECRLNCEQRLFEQLPEKLKKKYSLERDKRWLQIHYPEEYPLKH